MSLFSEERHYVLTAEQRKIDMAIKRKRQSVQYKPCRAEQDRTPVRHDAEEDLRLHISVPAHLKAENEVPEPAQPEETRTVSNREKATAASAPGSDYWLP